MSSPYINKIVSKGVMFGYVRQQIQFDPEPWSLWTVFIQSSQNHEMSDYVDHVTFMLHPDFSDNIRTYYKPPYETSVLGSLPCNAYVYVQFRDQLIPPCFFQISINFAEGQIYQKEVKYDNMLFVRPNTEFYKLLQIIRPAEKLSGLLHHIQPDLFKQLYPKARMIELKSNMKPEEIKKAFEDTNVEGEGMGCYVIEQVKREENIDKLIEKYANK
uniref:YEATS family protein n=1 Tax=Trepomonas sp. PC1 TaxID=1076344 RepID=A0A146KLV2_9EUKA|eukprot:JAP96321.1 YEATS family protein [Trepomonas sp. PC1]